MTGDAAAARQDATPAAGAAQRAQPLAPAVSRAAARGLAPTRAVLPNGVTVLAKAAHTTPAVTLHLAVRAGAVADPPGAEGVSHFVSRTLDRGTTGRSGDEIAEAIDGRGASLAMTVNRHVLSIVCTCLSEDVDRMLALLGEIVMAPVFAPEEVALRRHEIVTLIRQDEDNPAAVAVDRLMALLYDAAHPYGRRIRGTVESVEAIDAASLARFHAAHCVAGALSVAVVGGVEPSRAVDAAARVFERWATPPAPAIACPPAPCAASRRVAIVPMMNKAQADIAYGFTAIERAAPEYHAGALMNNILGQYALGGRLGDSIRERQGMAYYVFSSLDANVIAGALLIRAGVHASNVARTVDSIDTEVASLAAEGPTPRELAESTQYLIGSMPRMLETNAGIAQFLQTLEFFGLPLDYDVRLPGLLQAVTRDEVHAVARRLLDPARAAVVVAGPCEGPLR